MQLFRRFIPNFAKVSAPWTDLTNKSSGVHSWDESCDKVFEKWKTSIAEAPTLITPNWEKPFRGHFDASHTSVGGMLTQVDENGKYTVIAFFSKKLSPAERNYTANHRELIALVRFLERFRCYLEGSGFEIITNIQVLKYFLINPKLRRRETRLVETLENVRIFSITVKPAEM